jgi:undecaprenyl phosphate-alpha-L-ara4N flippase subunit ArnF
MKYLYIFGTLAFTVYGQMIIKWRLNQFPSLPQQSIEKMLFLFKALIDPFIFSGFVSAFIASLFWIAAMTQFEITKAYPFMSLAPALVFILGVMLLGEAFTWGKLVGLHFIIFGIFITVKF